MMKANTGSSVKSEAKAAGYEAAQKASKGLENPKVVFAYAASGYYGDLPDVVKGIGEALPGTPVIGSTAWGGVILPEGFVGGKHFVGLMVLSDPGLTVGIGAAENNGDVKTARKSGRKAAQAAMEQAGRENPPDYFYMSSMSGFEESYLKGIADVIGRKPVFGGSAVDELVTGDWDVFTHEGRTGYGVAVAFFYTDKPMVNHFTSEPYFELEEKLIIKKMETPRRLVSIEGKSLVERICERTGFDPNLLTAADLQQGCIQDPIGVKNQSGEVTVLKLPMCLRPDGSMDMGADLSESSLLVHMRAEIPDMVRASGKELEKLAKKMDGRAAAYHLFMGYGRGMVMINDGKLEKVFKNIRKAAGDTPFIMAFTLAECGFAGDGMNACGNLMISYTGFSE